LELHLTRSAAFTEADRRTRPTMTLHQRLAPCLLLENSTGEKPCTALYKTLLYQRRILQYATSHKHKHKHTHTLDATKHSAQPTFLGHYKIIVLCLQNTTVPSIDISCSSKHQQGCTANFITLNIAFPQVTHCYPSGWRVHIRFRVRHNVCP